MKHLFDEYGKVEIMPENKNVKKQESAENTNAQKSKQNAQNDNTANDNRLF